MAGKLTQRFAKSSRKPAKDNGKVITRNTHTKKRIVKPKRQTQSTRDEEKRNLNVVGANELKWKSVEIPDTMDDFGGFYGLEEIDGVDVKVVNGKVQFITRNDSNIKGPEPEEPSSQGEVEPSDGQEMEELVEFKNFDDFEEGELSAASSNGEDNENYSDNELGQEESENAGEQKQEQNHEESEANASGAIMEDNAADGELETNIFGAELSIPDNVEPDLLPQWTETMNLSMTTLQGLAAQGFTKPTDIQSMTIPPALEGKDIMGKASTGSGKTLAYGIPILERLVADRTTDKTVGLIFTPTRELAHQVTQHLQKLACVIIKKSPYAIISLTGGLSIQKQERLLKYDGCARIVVATPGRFLEMLERDPKLIDRFSQTDCLVLDEVDRLLQDGHFEEFDKILKHLGKARNMKKKVKSEFAGTGWQTMVFSATFSVDLFNKLSTTSWKKVGGGKDDDEMELSLKHLMTKIHFRSKPVIIDADPDHKIHSKIKESLIECLPTERDLFAYYFLTVYPGSTLIFCNAIDSVKKLNAYLNFLQVSSFQIHSSMTQKNRLKNLEKFQQNVLANKGKGKATVLIASDVAARGLDIPGINHVVHYHLPRSADVYIHRSGRTARGDQEGVSVMICSPQEAMGPLRKLRKVLASKSATSYGKKWQKDVPVFPIEPSILSQLRERGSMANTLAEDQLATRSLSKDENWLKKAADDLGIELDSEDEEKDVILAKNKFKKQNKQLGKVQLRSLQHELKELLQNPIRKDLRKSYLTGGLTNLADDIVKNRGHSTIIGQDRLEALDLLKTKNRK
ncbi:ATP-dependent RNA helicase [Lachancea thermotolerans CBS 6340]|uniref:RNA helicase n=1 Tax=Lachancea thermotolerans (strain ATCC 56472 / CBS 6340 / NRRL Y-8284) TaxID=559295 RepID=C5DNC4_LACTC|nr:KLTH0G15840p [Lachancea thermotolerans CBS 6340]CAR25285.1 KLTH0G15840p [Lachancea thermotolerans CBS 6340]